MKQPRYKRPFDLFVLIVAHIVLLPVMLLLWTILPIVIWLEDRGPVFYRQERLGKDGRVFTVRKFRTMVPNADQEGPAWTVIGDLRVTRVGRVLRRTALDELPGVLKIWSGDMSLVGPRALSVEEHRLLEEQVPGFEERLKARPGLTGLAQIYDKSDEANAKLRYDLEYIRRMSPLLDMKLLLVSLFNTVAAQWDKRSGKSSL